MAGQVALAAGGAVAGAVGGLLFSRGWNRRRLRKLLGSNFKLFTQQERQAALSLLDNGGAHLFGSWPPPGVHDQQKRRLLQAAASELQGKSAQVEAARQDVLRAPKAIKKPFRVKSPIGHARDDPYYWLRDDDRKDPEILDHLKAENDYAKAMLADTEQLQKDLVAEMRARIQEADESAPVSLDNQTLFYVTKDRIDRPFKLWRHRIGTDPDGDVPVLQEDDEQYTIHIYRSRDDQLLMLGTGSAITSDIQYLEANNPGGAFAHILPRKHNTEYDVWHRHDHIFLLVRDEARPNSELQVASMDNPRQTQVLLPHRHDVKLESVTVSKNFLVVFERQRSLQVATVFKLPGGGGAPEALTGGQQVKFDEPAYELGPGEQGDFDSDILRLMYTSLTTPATVLDHNMATSNRTTKKVTPILGGFDSGNYKTERQFCTAEDGTRVPFSFVYRKDVAKLDGSDPVLLNGYGSYEICNDPYFHRDMLSMIDRGFIFAMAHIRGGGEMGRQWYEQGKFLLKKNTFTDFIAVAQHLVATNVTTPQRLCIEGRSAGGLLMGAVLNMQPGLFSAAIAGVPFVDVVTTMLDESIPLTAGEWEEWGCPKEEQFYQYMLSYSPVDNVQRQAYPHILVTAGLWDPRVAYWEPAKWVAKLRAHKTDSNMLIMKCNLGAGHFSESGRFDRLKETAIEFAFLLKVQGML